MFILLPHVLDDYYPSPPQNKINRQAMCVPDQQAFQQRVSPWR